MQSHMACKLLTRVLSHRIHRQQPPSRFISKSQVKTRKEYLLLQERVFEIKINKKTRTWGII